MEATKATETIDVESVLEEGLTKFSLIAESAGDGVATACETSLLNWVDAKINGKDPDEDWGDALECAHPLIRTLMIRHNDHDETTDEQRREAVRLGLKGALDTWWIPVQVVLMGLSADNRQQVLTRHEQLTRMLTYVAGWKVNKVKPDLQGAYLQGAYLQGAYLQGAYLQGADLQGAYLQGAYLQGADLRGADLRGADLQGADLQGAYLQGAYLQGADLRGADLRGADLRGRLGWADAQGLELTIGLQFTIGEPASLPTGWEYKNGLIVKKAS